MEKNDKIEAPATKKEPNYRGVKAMPFVIGNETFEKLGTIGTSSNLLVYLTTVFNMKSITATNVINIFNGTCNFGTLLGAFISDTYLGRYKTLGIASISSFLGMLILTMTATLPGLHPPKCGSGECVGATVGQLAFLFTAFVFLVVGASGIRPCNLAFGADQFNPKTESGKRGINSFFNWYYFTFTFAMMVSLTVIVYVQASISWAVGLAIPAFLMFLSCAVFFVGTRIYVMILPLGSPMTSLIQTLVVAFKKRKLQLPDNPLELDSLFTYHSPLSINSKLAYTNQLRWLNKAAIIREEDEINADGSAADPWNLCSVQQVEEMKCVIRVTPIWISGVVYYVILALTQTYLVFQALQTDRRFSRSGNFKIPAATYNILTMMSLTIWIPVYDRLLVPLLRRVTRREEGITMLQRMGIGIFLAVVTMLVSGLVEARRRGVALTRPTLGVERGRGAVSAMSGYWLAPQLALAGVSEAFTVIGQIEFFYKQFPENMRSFAGSFLFCGFAISSYFTSFLVSVVHNTTRVGASGNWLAEDLNEGRLDYFYYLVAGLEALNLGYFLVCARWYRYKSNDTSDSSVQMEKLGDAPKSV
ncbi:protein NRT1/ PTR FAMILY 2.11 [Salvia miltiorrhiza]|uniref:protein NRT1/ PTR FAMILY 2.11 n=1 Tax=Salvia miltiorrhiza TaxID=226208 RepID=UPI0025ACFA77|nr:protein NRT1/ PTR FAMILY 2.11 [Salvia miltiorrhiza]